MGYKGRDLLLTGVAGQRSDRRPGLCVQAVGGGLVGRRLWFSDESALEAEDRRTTGLSAGLTAYATMRYTNRRLYIFFCCSLDLLREVANLLRTCDGETGAMDFAQIPAVSQLGTSSPLLELRCRDVHGMIPNGNGNPIGIPWEWE